MSRAFRHVHIDPGDYDLLGLHWHNAYVDTYSPFIFQRLSNAVHHIMCQTGFCVIDYINDYLGVGVPDIACASFASLFKFMNDLGLTINDSKLVPPVPKLCAWGS